VRGRCRRRCGEDGFPNAFDISKYLIIPETQHTVAMIGEPSISDGVAFVSRVLAAINFDDKPLFATNKVNDIWVDRLLADELKVAEPSRS
jgi:hypothetical protein